MAPAAPFLSQPRVSTGIDGLDNVLQGGLPSGHVYLVEGTPGAGKTTLGLQFLLDGRRAGEIGLYVTLSETRQELNTVAASHGWSLDGVEVFELIDADGLGTESEQSILHPSEVELGETTRGVMAAVTKLRPARVVFDSLSEMRLLAQDPLRYRRQILALKHFFSGLSCTVLLLDDKTSQGGDMQLHSIAHGVISLEQRNDQYGSERRHMRVAKLRGVKYRGGDHDFKLDTGGIAVYPRLVASEHVTGFEVTVASTGNDELDALFGGGIARGGSTLFLGPSGVGKTTTAIAVAVAALKRGDRVSYYLFDEGRATLLARSRELGMDITPYIESGLLDLVVLDPAEVSPGEFANMVRTAVDVEKTVFVVIDSLNAYMHAMPGGKFLLLQMHELLTFLNQQGVSTLLILGQHGLIGEVRSDVDLSYLSDSILLFRFFEAHGQLLKAVSVVKSRINAHEPTIRQFRLGRSGVQLGGALVDFEGVLSGLPSYKGSLPLLGAREGEGEGTILTE